MQKESFDQRRIRLSLELGREISADEVTFSFVKESLDGKEPLMDQMFYIHLQCLVCGLHLNLDINGMSELCPNGHGKFQVRPIELK